ncbi:Aldehyde dehydrogenase C-terminal [Penicillium angulare]|uniref:Aldehyde dehydrogenase n=1 Tax=Penicillium angulare TaxID=116970 RepID=A0A9W9FJ73_9EURO|nr:Aldehyde dehydrogenase C-terminal [Penicillium angulare]
MEFTTAAEFDKAYQVTRNAFDAKLTKGKDWRTRQLKRTWWMIEENKDRIVAALYKDLKRHRQETIITDCTMIQNDILHILANLNEWMRDEKPTRWDLINFMGGTTIRKEPKGVVLIIGAWNFPMLLLLHPMVAAIAAGCAIILKPSDMARASQDLLIELIPQYLDADAIRCVTAGPQEMQHILEHRFDHVFYTGSANIGKVVYAAAAKHLTPVTLELGGQGPAIVMPSANIELSAKHIAVTKFQNAGQICLTVNHILADPKISDALVEAMIRHFDLFMGGHDKQPEHYTSIVNERNFDRLDRLLKETKGKIVYGGQRDRSTRFFAPTIVTGVKPGDSLLSEELFGPILPIMEADLDSGLTFTRKTGQPLALYAFTQNSDEKHRILNEVQSGGVTFNDCMLHIVGRDAPFGGTGTSGFGYYHGYHGFREFSYLRTCTNAMPAWMESLMDARYPPYSLKKIKKLSPPVKPGFDRDGNDTSTRKLWKWTFGLGVLAVSMAIQRFSGQSSRRS